jgi:hypothetical protein
MELHSVPKIKPELTSAHALRDTAQTTLQVASVGPSLMTGQLAS